MLRYVGKRLMYGFLVLLGVVTLVFFLFNILPGDPARMMLGQRVPTRKVLPSSTATLAATSLWDCST